MSQKRKKVKRSKRRIPVVKGVISVSQRGVGFLAHESFDEDIMIPEGSLNTALNRDTVEVQLVSIQRNERAKGEVTRIVKRNKTDFVGVVEKNNNGCYIIPDDQKMYVDISIPNHEAVRLANGTKVLVSIIWNDPKKTPIGKVIKIIGKKGDHEVEIESIVLERGFVTLFPEHIEKEARKIKESSAITKEDEQERRDMRDIPTFTIDPVHAKDFDDALSFTKLSDNSYEIGIHIADVSYYVRPGSMLDQEAIDRGVSVYLVDRTIPMLPETLSNDLCSLNPGEDKRTFSAIFTINGTGEVSTRWFGKTLTRSLQRFSYEEAQHVIETGGAHAEKLTILNSIAKKLKQKRHKAGAIDFEEDEVRFELDKAGAPLSVVRKVRLDTHKLIEEFMLLANREVAEFISRIGKRQKKRRLFVYRVHDVPNPEKIGELVIFLKAIGYDLVINENGVSAKDLNALFKKIEGEASEGLIKTAALRAMSKAIYSTINIGHFGLAFKYYTHFTSPIRRYPDIMVHRLLEKYLQKEKISEEEFATYQQLATRSTQREISATEAERASIKFKQVEYMSKRIGKEFDAIISGVTEWGVYVEDTVTKAEGLIRIRSLGNEYFELDRKNYRIIGTDTKKSFSLGDTVRVKLIKADLDSRTLVFVLVPQKLQNLHPTT